MPDPNPNAAENPDPDICPFLRMWAVTRLTGLGRSTIYRLVTQNKFRRPCDFRTAPSHGAAPISNGGPKGARSSPTDNTKKL